MTTRSTELPAADSGTVIRIKDPEPVEVTFRGQRVKLPSVARAASSPEYVLVTALLALEDPRVDAILEAFQVELFDHEGNCIWPL